MKRFLLILLILIAMLVIGVSVFIATFDADRFRPQLTAQLEKALGRPVQLSHLSLRWRQGIAVRLEGLVIPDQPAGGEPLVQVDAIDALVAWRPLLHKDIQLSSLIVERPRLRAVRDVQGQINLFALAAVGAPTAASTQPATAGKASVTFNIASLRILEGTVHWVDASRQPPMDLQLNHLVVLVKPIALGQPMMVDGSAVLAGTKGMISLKGRVIPPRAGNQGALEQIAVTVEQIPLEALLPPPAPDAPALRGTLTTTWQGGVGTLDPATVLQAVSGTARVKMTDATLLNVNVLRSVFDRLSVLPGLVQTLEARLPESSRAAIMARDTRFAPIDLSAQMDHGTVRSDNLRLRADAFELAAAGQADVKGFVQLRGVLRIDRAFSSAMIDSVKELELLTNTDGQIEIPLTVEGQAPNLRPLPDVSSLTSKLVQTKARDLLNNLLERAIERRKSKDATPAVEPPAPQ